MRQDRPRLVYIYISRFTILPFLGKSVWLLNIDEGDSFIYLFIYSFQSSYREVGWTRVYIIKLKLISFQVNIDIRSLLCQGFQPDVVCRERQTDRVEREGGSRYKPSVSMTWRPLVKCGIRFVSIQLDRKLIECLLQGNYFHCQKHSLSCGNIA